MRELVVIFGLSGSGKSFLASILHEKCGYEWLRSDVIRKQLAGLKPEESAKADYGKGIYTKEITKKVYEEMVKRAKELIDRGKKVVLDATFIKRWQRELVLKNFKDPFFILAFAPEEVIKERLKSRKDVSDADWNIYLKQKEEFEAPEEIDYCVINTNKSKEELESRLKKLLGCQLK
ncbi:AAA family ATPase [Aquifex aeolicus]|uniref:gluconokinase n=1 Tax=Aquifex aeolicus (strain VF5) TaxID=224324 RepID=O67460_AQUAE|nr:AAA family ATPase [Aquifex aeolicus]AAC07427.1 hypothetical protein aq_1484 [Aquifex aeolicus VF5]